MLESIKEFFRATDILGATIYLVTGAFIGAIISVIYSLRAHRPKLIISGGGSGGNQHGQKWQISISNRPSFFGQNLDGESARDVHAHIRLEQKRSQTYAVYWGNQGDQRVTIEPGQRQSLELFAWQEDSEGYCIVDSNGDPVARFHDRELKFTITLRDRLERKTEFRLTVDFDDSHLKNKPSLRIIHPITLRDRLHRAKSGLQEFISAFRAR